MLGGGESTKRQIMATKNEENIKNEREADIDRLWKKMSVQKHEKLRKDMRDLVTRFRLRASKYESKVVYDISLCTFLSNLESTINFFSIGY